MQWSHYSQRLFEEFTTTDHNIIVQACPGAGKTTNIKHLWTLDDKAALYLVFNKHNQLEAEANMPQKQGSAVKTLNGLGASILYNNFGRSNLDKNKVNNIVRDMLRKPQGYSKHGRYHQSKDQQEREWSLIKAVSKAKMLALSGDFTLAEYEQMISTYDMDEYSGMYDHVVQCLQISDSKQDVIDFDDQIRFPAIYDLHMPQFHNVLVDEAQDLSPIQAQLVSKLLAQRYVFVGDKRQSIYAFRGAMCDSMDYLKAQFNCVELPLSITYRCAKTIVAEAAKVWPGDIEAWEESPDGSITVYTGGHDSLQLGGDAIVLCRTNKPLITYAYELLKQGIACYVRGRDIGEGLVRLINRQEAPDVRTLIDCLQNWKDVELAKAAKREDENRVQSVNDKFDSCMVFVDRCKLTDSPTVVVEHINSLFEQGKGVCLSTVHKAKGLEADAAYLLEAGLFDSFKAKAKHEYQREQEKNIKYVAVTRAKTQLMYM